MQSIVTSYSTIRHYNIRTHVMRKSHTCKLSKIPLWQIPKYKTMNDRYPYPQILPLTLPLFHPKRGSVIVWRQYLLETDKIVKIRIHEQNVYMNTQPHTHTCSQFSKPTWVHIYLGQAILYPCMSRYYKHWPNGPI